MHKKLINTLNNIQGVAVVVNEVTRTVKVAGPKGSFAYLWHTNKVLDSFPDDSITDRCLTPNQIEAEARKLIG